MSLASACDVPANIRRATISPAPDQRSEHRQLLQIDINKGDLRQLAESGIYTYIHVIDCNTSELIFSVYPNLHGATPGEPRKMLAEIERAPDEYVTIQGYIQVDREMQSRSICVKLSGGGYSLRKVRSNVIAVTYR